MSVQAPGVAGPGAPDATMQSSGAHVTAEADMQRFIIERTLPDIGSADREAMRNAAQRSNKVLKDLGPDIQWVESYVADNKTFCVYLAKDEDIIREHARQSGFRADKTPRSERSSIRRPPRAADARHRRGNRRRPARRQNRSDSQMASRDPALMAPVRSS